MAAGADCRHRVRAGRPDRPRLPAAAARRHAPAPAGRRPARRRVHQQPRRHDLDRDARSRRPALQDGARHGRPDPGGGDDRPACQHLRRDGRACRRDRLLPHQSACRPGGAGGRGGAAVARADGRSCGAQRLHPAAADPGQHQPADRRRPVCRPDRGRAGDGDAGDHERLGGRRLRVLGHAQERCCGDRHRAQRRRTGAAPGPRPGAQGVDGA
jgi:hypothetical protein